jgi:hypothetical protein
MIEIDGLYFPEITTDARTMRALTIAKIVIDATTEAAELIGKNPMMADIITEITKTGVAMAVLTVPLYPERLKLGGGVLPVNDRKVDVPPFIVREDYD